MNNSFSEIIRHFFELYISHILVAITTFLIGFFFQSIRARWQDRKFRKFFGAQRNVPRIKVVYGQFGELVDSKDKLNPNFANAQKTYNIGTKRIVFSKRFSEFVGTLTIKSVNYLNIQLLKHKHYPSKVCTDTEAVEDFTSSFISIGGPAVNELTHSIMDRPDNVFFEFDIPDKPSENKQFELFKKKEGKNELLPRMEGFDYGIIIRLDNKHEHDNIKNSVYFVCAGLGSHGTCGACYFLANNWKKLYHEFGTNEFGILLKVTIGAATDVQRIENKKVYR